METMVVRRVLSGMLGELIQLQTQIDTHHTEEREWERGGKAQAWKMVKVNVTQLH